MITKEQALAALEDMDDCARMDIGVAPTGAYAVLEKYIHYPQAKDVVQEAVNRIKHPDNISDSKWEYVKAGVRLLVDQINMVMRERNV